MFKMIKEIKYKDKVIAIIYRKSEGKEEDSINFLTPDENNFQVGILNHSKGHIIPTHLHFPIERNIIGTDEMLYIEEGKMKVIFHNKAGEIIGEEILEKGDLVNLIYEYHGFEFLEKSRIIYVKQGPYKDKKTDKKIL